jgi:predicted RecA/RadA family phage recombinase
MATNLIQAGSQITIPAPELVSSGAVVIAGSIVGVALGDAAPGQPVDVALTGIWELRKVGAQTHTLGEPVFWDNTADLVTETAAGNTRLGTVARAAGAGVATVAVRLVSI